MDLIVKLLRGAFIAPLLNASVDIPGRRLVVTNDGLNLIHALAVGDVGSLTALLLQPQAMIILD